MRKPANQVWSQTWPLKPLQHSSPCTVYTGAALDSIRVVLVSTRAGLGSTALQLLLSPLELVQVPLELLKTPLKLLQKLLSKLFFLEWFNSSRTSSKKYCIKTFLTEAIASSKLCEFKIIYCGIKDFSQVRFRTDCKFVMGKFILIFFNCVVRCYNLQKSIQPVYTVEIVK